jgi:L-arabinose 1-dehydrogenase [NAD(P)+]
MACIAVTGAAGRIGRETLAALSDTDHEVHPITHRERDGIESTICDVTDLAGLSDAIEGCDTVIHLAGNPDPGADWESVLSANIDGTRAVYESAVRAGCERVIFASTNHVTHAHNLPPGGTWDDLEPDSDPIRIGDPVRTDSFYAVSKVAGEALGDYYAHRHGIEALDLRIGWYLTRDELSAKQSEPDPVAHYARAIWLSPGDCRHGMRRAVDAALPEDHVTVNLTSANGENYLSLVEARRALDYHPRDDSYEALDTGDADR